MKIKVKRTAFLSLALFALMYFVFSFCFWDFNPENWEVSCRIFFCVMCFFCVFFSAFVFFNPENV